MTKQEIQALIDAKIAGQGSAVDAGGALPQILTEILNLAASGANVQSDWGQSDNKEPDYIKNKPTIPPAYTLPTASAEVLGGVKVGSGLSINENGVLSVGGMAGVVAVNLADATLNEDDYSYSVYVIPNFDTIKNHFLAGDLIIVYGEDIDGSFNQATVVYYTDRAVSSESGDELSGLKFSNVLGQGEGSAQWLVGPQ